MARLNGVTDCEVLVVEPYKRLFNSWNASGEEAVHGPKTVVTWTLTPTKGGTHVRMEQSGFRPEDEANYQGAGHGWQKRPAWNVSPQGWTGYRSVAHPTGFEPVTPLPSEDRGDLFPRFSSGLL